MFRYIENELKSWRKQAKHKPILLRGARQVGKSYIVEKFAAENFTNFIKIDFEKEVKYHDFFSGDLNMKFILEKIALSKNKRFDIENTLIFFDEIQECPRAITALRYIYEELPELCCIAAGSLLEFALMKHEVSMPVGRIQYLYMQPVSFYEYLIAINAEAKINYIKSLSLQATQDSQIHDLLIEEFKKYMFIGGMPEVLDAYIKNTSLQEVLQIQQSIIDTYRDDFRKYSTKAQHKYVEKTFDTAAKIIGQKFKYSKIDSDAESKDIKDALELLCKARLFKKVAKTSGESIPLSFHASMKHFKVIFLDVGLMHNMLGISQEVLVDKDLHNLAAGALAEQACGQELMAYQDYHRNQELYYWERDGRNISAELDYVSVFNNQPYGIEVKSGKRGKLKSLYSFMRDYKHKLGICVTADELSFERDIVKIPIYAVAEIERILCEL